MGITDFFSDLLSDASSFLIPTAHADAPSKDEGDDDKKDEGGDNSEDGDKKDDKEDKGVDDDGGDKEEGGEDEGGEGGGDDEEEEEEEEIVDPKPKLEAGMCCLRSKLHGLGTGSTRGVVSSFACPLANEVFATKQIACARTSA